METDKDKIKEEIKRLEEEYLQISFKYKQALLNLPRPPHPKGKEAAIKYQELLNKYANTFTDWLDNKFISTHSIFKFTASPKYAIETMNQFEKEHK